MKLCPKCQKQFSDDANFCPVDAARLIPLETQATGADSLTSRFELGPKLGGGVTGAVHRATDKQSGKPCAVKLVSPAVIALTGVAQRIERELKQLERVQSVGVARVMASGKRGEETWLAMELLEGAQTLAQAITARGPIPPGQAADLIEVIGEALIEAAQVGVVHRDLAPKNVLFAGQDVKLINFSLPVPTTDKVPGVPEFVAPEQVEGRPVDQRSNLYSLGALYYYVLTGQPVFTGPPAEVHRLHTQGTIRPPSVAASGVQLPPQVEAVIMRALDRSPTKRFLTVRQFVDEVTRVGHGEVIELKQTMAMGKANQRPKGELVQTLMGMRAGELLAAAVSSRPPAQTAAAGMAGQAARPPGGQQVQLPGGHVGMTPLTPPASGVDPQRSPWQSPPAQGPAAPTMMGAPAMPAPMVPQPAAPMMPQPGIAPPSGAPMMPAPPQVAAPIVAAPVVAPPVMAPVVAAPVVAAPQVAAPQVAAAPAGKKRGGEEGKGKFRETMWFKKGDLDAQAAAAAAEERARTGKDVSTDKADSLPIDERYKDDGSITRSDKEKYSLRTGATMMMDKLPDNVGRPDASMNKVSEDALIGEMKGGRTKVIFAIIAAIIAIALIVFFVAR